MTNSFIRAINRTISDATHPGQSGPGNNGNEGHSPFPKDQALVDPHRQIVLCHNQDTCRRSLTDLQRSSQYILQLKRIGLSLFGILQILFINNIDNKIWSNLLEHIWQKNIVILFTNPSTRAEYDTRSIFKRSLTGFKFRVFLLLD